MAAGIPSLVGPRECFGSMVDTGALEVIQGNTAEAIAKGLDQLEPGGENWQRRADAGLRAHTDTFHCEAQLAPLLNTLGLDR
jgi:hypothetical protein